MRVQADTSVPTFEPCPVNGDGGVTTFDVRHAHYRGFLIHWWTLPLHACYYPEPEGYNPTWAAMFRHVGVGTHGDCTGAGRQGINCRQANTIAGAIAAIDALWAASRQEAA